MIKSNKIVDYYIKCAKSHLEYSNLKEAGITLEASITFAENDEYLEKISIRQF